MGSHYHTLLSNQTTDGTSSVFHYQNGQTTFFITGTFGHSQTRVVIEASFDGTNWAPVDGFDDISEVTAKFAHFTRQTYIRASVTNAHAQNSPNLTVVMM